MMSLPRNLASLRKQFYFSLFYTTTVVFAFMNTVIYWFITRPHDIETAPGDKAPDDNNPGGNLHNGNDPKNGDASGGELWRVGGYLVSGTPCKELL